MWKPLQKSPPYFITFLKESDDLYYIGITDYKRYWINNTSKKSFLADLKESNEGLEFDDENELVEKGLDMLNNPEQLKKVSILQGDLGKFLSVSMTKVYEIPLKLELGLIEASSEHFFAAVIKPLLKIVCDLRSSQHELRQLLLKKDREIEEYKIEGKAPRRLITTVYDDAAHMMKHTSYDQIFGQSGVPELLEATAYSDEHKNIQKVQLTGNLIRKPAEKGQQSTVTPTKAEKPENGGHPGPTYTHSVIPKAEDDSHYSLFDEIASITPTHIEETEIPTFVVQSTAKHKKDVKTESDNRLPRKRTRNRLNY